MPQREHPDTLNTRFEFRLYAAVVGLCAASVALLGQTWIGNIALARVFASLLAASTCWAVVISQIDNPEVRRRSVWWFAGAHVLVLFVLDAQLSTLLPKDRVSSVDTVLSSAIIVISTLLPFRKSRRKHQPLTIPEEPLQSIYERQIREAGAQEERNRLARDLHDSIRQQIFVIQTAAATAQVRLGNDPSLEQVRDSARDAMTEMEVMMDQLKSAPLENTGLVGAIRKQCEALGHRTGAQVECSVGELPASESLAPGAHQAILRVVQEALANIGRHARAQSITVSIRTLKDRLELRIQDDGQGFDPAQHPQGMGIKNMKERAEEFGGRFDLSSTPGIRNDDDILPSTPRGNSRCALQRGSVLRPGAAGHGSNCGDEQTVSVGLDRCDVCGTTGSQYRRGSQGGRLKVVSVVLVDDHRVVTQSLKAWLESFPDMKVVGIAVSGEELLQHLGQWNPDVILQDLLMPGGLDGIETTRRILQLAPAAKVIALTASMDEARMMGVLRAGAVGYVRKDAEPEILIAAVRAVAAGRTYIDPSVSKRILLNPNDAAEELTPRETDVLRQLALGRSNKEIATALSIGEETVKSHVGGVFGKLQVENRAQAVVRAIKLRIVSLEELD